jgi:small redox-active disulfide protein 2
MDREEIHVGRRPGLNVKILGTGCANCKKLYSVVEEALVQTGIQAELTKVEDVQAIMRYGVMSTPALVIDETVVSAGKVPRVAEVSSWLTTASIKEHGVA